LQLYCCVTAALLLRYCCIMLFYCCRLLLLYCYCTAYFLLLDYCLALPLLYCCFTAQHLSPIPALLLLTAAVLLLTSALLLLYCAASLANPGAHSSLSSSCRYSTQFTCFTSTKGHIVAAAPWPHCCARERAIEREREERTHLCAHLLLLRTSTTTAKKLTQQMFY
jgi:hypothetical protein